MTKYLFHQGVWDLLQKGCARRRPPPKFPKNLVILFFFIVLSIKSPIRSSISSLDLTPARALPISKRLS